MADELIAVGQTAPDFSLPATTLERGEKMSLSNFWGKKVLLAFYVLDFTGG